MNVARLLSILPGLTKRYNEIWDGPCPFCGGKNRFTLKPFEGENGQWWCRKAAAPECSARISPANGSGFGDCITLVMKINRCGYVEACDFLGVERRSSSRGRYAPRYSAAKSVAAPVRTVAPVVDDSPFELVMPSDVWIEQASRLVDRAVRTLSNSREGIAYAERRGFYRDWILESQALGWIAADEYPLAKDWGIEGGKEKIRIPAGLLIVSRREGRIVGLTVRQVGEGIPHHERFRMVRGGASMRSTITGKMSLDVPFFIGEKGQGVIICESAIDALLVRQETDNLLSVVAMNGGAKGRDKAVDEFINKFSPVAVLVPDNDEGGQAAWAKWQKWFPHAFLEVVPRLPVQGKDESYTKDLGDIAQNHFLHLSKICLRDWLSVALQNASEQNRERIASLPCSEREAITFFM